MKPVLIEIDPMNVATGSRVTYRVADGASADVFGIGGFVWTPAIVRRPVFNMELFNLVLDAQIQAGRASFEISLREMGLAGRNDLKWEGAPVRIWLAPDLRLTSTPYFSGILSQPQIDLSTGQMQASAKVRTDYLDKPSLTAQWVGSGGANGDDEMRGVYKPLGYGVCLNVPVLFFDTTNWIGCIDGYGNLQSVQKLMEGLNSWGSAVANYASYSALQTAISNGTVKPGQWATCIASGLIGLGAPPVKPITVNATFQKTTPGAIMRALIETQGGISSSLVDTASFAALDVACPYQAHYWSDQQRNIDDILGAMASAFNATCFVGFDGKISVTRATRSSSVLTFDLSGGQVPRVTDKRSGSPISPFWAIKAKAEQPETVLSYEDVIFEYDLVPVGLFDIAKTYQPGNIVTGPDGATYLVKGDSPVTGQALPTGDFPAENAYWIQQQPALTAADIVYDSQTGATVGDVLSDPNRRSLLSDQTFTDAFWTLAANASRVSYTAAVSDYALQVSFQASTAAYTVYAGTKATYANIRPRKLAYVSATVDSTPGTDATWDLIVAIDWYTSTKTFISTTTVTTIAPSAGGEQFFVLAVQPPNNARRGRLKFGHASTTGKTGQWTIYDPLLSHEEPGSSQSTSVQGPADTVIACTAAGSPKTGEVNPRYVQFLLIRQGVDVTNEASWSRTLLTGSITSSMGNTANSNKGRLNITAVDTAGQMTISASYQGITYTLLHEVKKSLDPNVSGSGGGGSATGAISGTINTTSMVAISDEMEVLVGSGGNVALSANYTYYIYTGAYSLITCRWYEWNGSSYVAIGSEVGATTAATITGDAGWDQYNPGYGACNYTRTGLTAGTTKKFRLYGKGTDTNTRYVGGTISGAGS